MDKEAREKTHGCKFCNWTGTVLNQWDNTEDCPVCKNKPWVVQKDKPPLFDKDDEALKSVLL